jgi:hypothetical protein
MRLCDATRSCRRHQALTRDNNLATKQQSVDVLDAVAVAVAGAALSTAIVVGDPTIVTLALYTCKLVIRARSGLVWLPIDQYCNYQSSYSLVQQQPCQSTRCAYIIALVTVD